METLFATLLDRGLVLVLTDVSASPSETSSVSETIGTAPSTLTMDHSVAARQIVFTTTWTPAPAVKALGNINPPWKSEFHPLPRHGGFADRANNSHVKYIYLPDRKRSLGNGVNGENAHSKEIMTCLLYTSRCV